MILKIWAKCNDCCSGVLIDDNGEIRGSHDGYVPRMMPNGGDDYIDLEIDVATGQIQNWKAPTEEQLQQFK